MPNDMPPLTALVWRLRRKLASLATVAALLAAAAWCPVTTVTVPEWSVQVVDPEGRAVGGACVYQSWLQYSFESGTGHDDEAKADNAGKVTFAERTATATVLQRVARPLQQLSNVHSSYGAHSWIIAVAPRRQGSVIYHGRDTLPTKVILHPESVQFEWEKGSIAARCSPTRSTN